MNAFIIFILIRILALLPTPSIHVWILFIYTYLNTLCSLMTNEILKVSSLSKFNLYAHFRSSVRRAAHFVMLEISIV